jgi:FAD/FMN-containing dehydrogenase
MAIATGFVSALEALHDVLVLRDRELVSARQEVARAELVVRPESPDAVGAILQAAQVHGQPLVILAGNTGLVGAGVPAEDEVVLDLGRLVNLRALHLADGRTIPFSDQRTKDLAARLTAWDEELGRARERFLLGPSDFRGARVAVEAAITVDGLNAFLRPLGIEYPMDMGSNAAATVGACAANASAGARAVRNGTGRDLTAVAEGWWASGERARCVNPSPGQHLPAPGSLAIDASRFPLGDSLIGSQGTLGVITQLEVLTSPLPQSSEVVLFGVETLAEGTALIERARAFFAAHGESLELAELMDRPSVDLVSTKEGLTLPFDDPATAARPFFIMLQVRADTDDVAESLAERLLAFVESSGALATHAVYDPTPGQGNAIRRVRHSITHASDARLGEMRREEALARGLSSSDPALLTARLGFDVAVPTDRADAFADAWHLRVATEFQGLEVHVFGHLGVGGFHIHHRGPMTAATKRAVQEAMATTVLAFNGTFSAEHGVGTLWTPLFLAHQPAADRAAIHALFRRRDPASILNPRCFGKR